MRRPIVAVLLGFAGGITIEYYINLPLVVLLLLLCVFAVGLATYFSAYKKVAFRDCMEGQLFSISRLGATILFAGFLFLGAISFSWMDENSPPLLDQEGERVTIKGSVLSVQKKEEDYYKITLRTKEEKVLVNVAGKLVFQGTDFSEAHLVGRELEVRGIVEKPNGRRNPSTFNYQLYLKTRGIYAIVKANSNDLMLASNDINHITNNLAKLKYGFIEKLGQSVDAETMGVLVGMLFGDKTLIDEDTYEAFQRNGIAHILSVSGIHVGIVYVCMNKLFGNRRTWTFTLISIGFLLFYAALAEFSPSVVRAVSMIVVHMVAKLSLQRYDLTSCTCACAFAMLLINPFYLFNVGFQLSYLAVLTLAVVLPWTNRRIEFLKEGNCPDFMIMVLSFAAPLLVIQVGMAPYTAYCFNYFSVASFILNIPIIFLAGWVIPVGIILMGIFLLQNVLVHVAFMEYVLGSIFDFVGFVEVLLIGSMNYVNELFYETGKSFFFVVSPSPFAILVYYSLMFFLFSELFRIYYQRKEWIRIGKIVGIGIAISFLLTTFLIKDYSEADLVFVDVGQGDCLHIRTPNGKNILIDGGGSLNYDVGEKVLMPYLLKNGVKTIDMVVLTHFHEDHYGGIRSLAKNLKIEKLGSYEANEYREKEILEETTLGKENLMYFHAGKEIQVEEGVRIEILYPEKRKVVDYKNDIANQEDENKNSLVVKVHYEELSILMTGDLGFEGETALLEAYDKEDHKLSANILKMGHHGSKYSTGDEFLTKVNPKVAVFQVGKNNFGHPNQGVIEKCQNSGIMVYRNDTLGAIILSKGKQWHIETMIKENILIKK